MKHFIFIILVSLLVGCNAVIGVTDKLIVSTIENRNRSFGKYSYTISVPGSPNIIYYSNNPNEFKIGDEIVLIKKEEK